jgi:hypothetical protein
VGAYINSARQSASRAERLAIEKEIAEQEQARAYAAAAPDRERAAQQVEYERRELRKDLILGYEGSDFTGYKTYDGRFPDAASVETAIRAAWNEFLAAHDLDQQAKTTITMFLQQHPNADITLLETWELAHDYLVSRLCPPPEAPIQPVAEVPAARVTNPFKYGSREAERWDREQYKSELFRETLLGEEYKDILADIVNPTGKTLSGENSIKFLTWLSAPAQKRRFKSKQDVKFAFAEFFNAPEILTTGDREELQRRANIESYTSDDIKQLVGSRNTYDPSNDAYRAGRS